MQPDEDSRRDSHAAPQTSFRRSGEDGGPRRPTAVGTEGRGSELLVVNRTSEVWSVYCHDELRGRMQPRDDLVIGVGGPGVLFAVLEAVPDVGLRAHTDETTRGVEILDRGQEAGGYELRHLCRRPRLVARVEVAASIEELNLLARTENALKWLGIRTVAEVLHTEADDILALPRYPLLCLFDLLEQVRGMNVL